MRKRKSLALLAALLVLTLSAGCTPVSKPEEPPVSSEEPEPEPEPAVINPLTGEDGFPESAVGKRPVAVMVSNIKDSLPQWGITDADLIYEAVTEGGITRLMCLYADPDSVPKVGPTRSAREYFPQLSEPFHALYVHFGGSTTGYEAIREYGIEDIDGMVFAGSTFLQDADKVAQGIGQEHTFYTDSSLLAPAIAKKGYSMDFDCPTAFPFSEDAVLPDGRADEIKVRLSGYITATFTYDSAKGVYLRSQYGEPHIDANNQQQVAVENVVILYAPVSKIPNTYLSRYDLTGGDGYYLSQGKVRALRWTKGAYNNSIVYTDPNGGEISFFPGKTWVCVVPLDERDATVLTDSTAADNG